MDEKKWPEILPLLLGIEIRFVQVGQKNEQVRTSELHTNCQMMNSSKSNTTDVQFM
jgi:hypothetical protein